MLRLIRIVCVSSLLAVPLGVGGNGPVHGVVPEAVPLAGRNTVVGVEFLGAATVPTGTMFEGTVIGGLSGISFDPAPGEYTIVSDDRAAARTYTATIDLSDGALGDGDVAFTGVTSLLDRPGVPFAPLSIDPEGIALSAGGSMYVSSEGDAGASPPIDPFVRRFTHDGAPLGTLPVPEHFLPAADDTAGVRPNLAFESLTLSPDERHLYTATESALVQDGPVATLDEGTISRILVFGPGRRPVRELVYEVEPIPSAPVPPGGFADNGLVELLAIDNAGTLLALERSFAAGVGNDVSLWELRTAAAVDAATFDALAGLEPDPPVGKELVLDFSDLGIPIDNLEGMTFGPVLPDGRPSLIVVSDNNFSAAQVTQFLAFALDIHSVPIVAPKLETPRVLDGVDPLPNRERPGDSDDPAVWIHPKVPSKSRVLTTAKEGGLRVLDLDGRLRQEIRPRQFGDVSYNNVDVIEDFPLSRHRRVDLVVASDRVNDTVAIWEIDRHSGRLRDLTSPLVPSTVFGVDDGEATAYGLTAYRSPRDRADYVFVTQASGNHVAQLRLSPDRNGRVTATTVRMIDVPVLDGDPAESQTEGLVADPSYGRVYVAMENGLGVLSYDAEPNGGDDFTLAYDAKDDLIEPDVEGLAIYEARHGRGYLIVSSQGDGSFVVFDRRPPHRFIGSFVLGGRHGIDTTDESDGVDVVNVPLGRAFPKGLFVAHDGQDDPPFPNLDEDELENAATNFTYADWSAIAKELDIIVDTRE